MTGVDGIKGQGRHSLMHSITFFVSSVLVDCVNLETFVYLLIMDTLHYVVNDRPKKLRHGDTKLTEDEKERLEALMIFLGNDTIGSSLTVFPSKLNRTKRFITTHLSNGDVLSNSSDKEYTTTSSVITIKAMKESVKKYRNERKRSKRYINQLVNLPNRGLPNIPNNKKSTDII